MKLINEETSETRATVSGDEGEFALSSLAPGAYRLEVIGIGFAKTYATVDASS